MWRENVYYMAIMNCELLISADECAVSNIISDVVQQQYLTVFQIWFVFAQFLGVFKLLLVVFSACGGIRTGSKLPVLTAYFPVHLGEMVEDCLTGLT